jgi:hypothetical protein
VEPELPEKEQNNQPNQNQVKSPCQSHDRGHIHSTSRKSYSPTTRAHIHLCWTSQRLCLNFWNDSIPESLEWFHSQTLLW